MKTMLSILAAAALSLAACGDSPTAVAGPAMAQNTGSLTFSYEQSQSMSQPQTAQGAVGGIQFSGTLTTGTPCVTVTAAQVTRRNTVTVTVTAAQDDGICMQVVTFNNYQGMVSGLAPGSYDFTVMHEVGRTRSVAYDGQVTVQ